jgi:hypothetical protein
MKGYKTYGAKDITAWGNSKRLDAGLRIFVSNNHYLNLCIMKTKDYRLAFLITFVYWALGCLVLADMFIFKKELAPPIIRLLFFPAIVGGIIGGLGDAGNWVVNMGVAQLISLALLYGIVLAIYSVIAYARRGD